MLGGRGVSAGHPCSAHALPRLLRYAAKGEWLVQSTKMVPVGTKVGIKVDPFNIQIMKKPESEDEEAIGVNE